MNIKFTIVSIPIVTHCTDCPMAPPWKYTGAPVALLLPLLGAPVVAVY